MTLYKLQNWVLQACQNDLVVDGSPVGNVLGNEDLQLQLGYKPLVETEKPLGDFKPFYTETETEIIQTWESFIPEPVVYSLSKIKLVRALEDIGKSEYLIAYIQSEAKRLFYWNSAVTLDSNDPLVLSAVEVLKSQLGFTDAQIEDLFKACVSDII